MPYAPQIILPLDLSSPSSQDLLAMLVPPVESVSELLPQPPGLGGEFLVSGTRHIGSELPCQPSLREVGTLDVIGVIIGTVAGVS